MKHLESSLILAELDFTARFVAAVLYLRACVFVHVLEQKCSRQDLLLPSLHCFMKLIVVLDA